MCPASVPTSAEFESLTGVVGEVVASVASVRGEVASLDEDLTGDIVSLTARVAALEAGEVDPPVDPEPVTLYSLVADRVPVVPVDADGNAVELGMRFTTSQAGKVQAIRFYKGGASNGGTHVGRLYNEAGVVLATVTFVNETSAGWQTAELGTPVQIEPGQTYTVSYMAPQAHYSVTANGFATAITSGPLTSVGGSYRYGTSGGFPTSPVAHNYFVDVVFLPGVSTEPPVVNPPVSVLDLPRVPWEGGAAYYDKFPKAKAAGWSAPSFFPISVFYGKPEHTSALLALGINTLQGAEHDGSTMASITSKGMFVIPQAEWTRTEVGNDARVVGWHVSDECEMGYGGCLDSNDQWGRLNVQRQMVEGLRAYNDGRFMQANFGNGVLRTYWGTDTMDDHVALLDVACVDKYCYTSPHVQGLLPGSPDWPAGANPKSAAAYGWLQDQMEKFQSPIGSKPNWVFVETAKPYLTESGATSITPAQLEGAVWSAIIHEARGIAYFQHNNDSTQGNYSLITGTAALKAKVTAVNAKVRDLAPVINTQSYVWNFGPGVDTMLKATAGFAYVFAGIGLLQSPGTKTFTLPAGVTGTSVEVVGESRTIPVAAGKFTDAFATEATHHVYKIAL